MRTLIATLFLLSSSATLIAAEAPTARKPGLWEIKSTLAPSGRTNTIRICVDAASEQASIEGKDKMPEHCTKNDMVQNPDGKISTHSVCKINGITATARAEFSGNFTTHYQADIKISYDPPLQGIKESHMTESARWLSACESGMKPGVIHPAK